MRALLFLVFHLGRSHGDVGTEEEELPGPGSGLSDGSCSFLHSAALDRRAGESLQWHSTGARFRETDPPGLTRITDCRWCIQEIKFLVSCVLEEGLQLGDFFRGDFAFI